MCTVERIFHPIGQGAFYSESLQYRGKEFNIVYDCGSYNEGSLNGCIKQFSKKTIDILFISHFHIDHINGIIDLCKGRNVKNIIMPYLDTIDKLAYVGCCSNRYVRSLIQFLYASNDIFPDTHIIYVNDNYEEGNELIDIEVNKKDSIKSGCRLKVFSSKNKECTWVLVPTNVKFNEKRDEFITELKNASILKAPADILDVNTIKTNLSKIQHTYELVFGKRKINNTSLLLYSGCDSPHEDICHRHCEFNRVDMQSCHLMPCGCLYMGDIELKPDVAKNILSNYYKYNHHIGLIQIPHHGSNTSNNALFWQNYTGRIGVMSYGKTNRYKHPNKDMLLQLAQNVIFTAHVTNDITSKLIIKGCCFCW